MHLDPVERKAWLVVRSNVSDDTIYVDDRALGPTGPQPHALAPDDYRIRVENADGRRVARG